MLLISVVPEGWKGPVHMRQSEVSCSESLAVPVRTAVMVMGEDKKVFPSYNLHQLQDPGAFLSAWRQAGNTPSLLLGAGGGAGSKQDDQES